MANVIRILWVHQTAGEENNSSIREFVPVSCDEFDPAYTACIKSAAVYDSVIVGDISRIELLSCENLAGQCLAYPFCIASG